jgi:hypothetical protein
MTVFRFLHSFGEVKQNSALVLIEKGSAFTHGRKVGWTRSSLAVKSATKHAFHSDPLRHNDVLGVYPTVILIAMFLNEFL